MLIHFCWRIPSRAIAGPCCSFPQISGVTTDSLFSHIPCLITFFRTLPPLTSNIFIWPIISYRIYCNSLQTRLLVLLLVYFKSRIESAPIIITELEQDSSGFKSLGVKTRLLAMSESCVIKALLWPNWRKYLYVCECVLCVCIHRGQLVGVGSLSTIWKRRHWVC